MAKSLFERFPSVQEILDSPALRGLVDRVNHHAVVTEVRSFLENLRTEIQARASDLPLPTPSELADRIAEWIQRKGRAGLRPVINATGELLDPTMGRAPLAAVAINALIATAGDYCDLELALETGQLRPRYASVEQKLCELTGAERAICVNNGTAAVVLTLRALAAGRQVIVSRGELIETSERERLPDAFAASGAMLREVGTTNCTRLDDYQSAYTAETAAIFKFQASEMCMVGHQESVELSPLVAWGHSRRIPVIADLGAGTLIDLRQYGIGHQMTARDALATGADVVLVRGDQWLGGPPCGIILCRRAIDAQLRENPLARAVQLDKLNLAALLATLDAYDDPTTVEQQIPVLSLVSTSIDNLKNRADRLAPQIAASAAVRSAEVVPRDVASEDDVTKETSDRSWCIVVEPKGRSAKELAGQLRSGTPAVVPRVQADRVWLDLRTVFPRQDQALVAALLALTETK